MAFESGSPAGLSGCTESLPSMRRRSFSSRAKYYVRRRVVQEGVRGARRASKEMGCFASSGAVFWIGVIAVSIQHIFSIAIGTALIATAAVLGAVYLIIWLNVKGRIHGISRPSRAESPSLGDGTSHTNQSDSVSPQAVVPSECLSRLTDFLSTKSLTITRFRDSDPSYIRIRLEQSPLATTNISARDIDKIIELANIKLGPRDVIQIEIYDLDDHCIRFIRR